MIDDIIAIATVLVIIGLVTYRNMRNKKTHKGGSCNCLEVVENKLLNL